MGESEVGHTLQDNSLGFGGVVHADEAASETGGLCERTPAARVAVHDGIARIGGGEDDALDHGGVLLGGVEGALRVLVFPDVLGHLARGFVGVVYLARVAGGAPVDKAIGVKF